MRLRIAHVDMDAFFASVEERADPRLKGLPLLVGGGPPRREVVTTASYPARLFGVRSGMSLREALLRCPQARYLPVDPPKYIAASEALLRIFEAFTPVVEPASIDEVFLDLAGMRLDDHDCLELAHRIQETVRKVEQLSCSIGLGSSKLQARMASRLEKPGGITALHSGDFEMRFWDRPSGVLWGVGPKTSSLLEKSGFRTIGDLARAPVALLEGLFGVSGRVLKRMARGEGGGPVIPGHREALSRSMGHEVTFSRNEPDLAVLEKQLLLLCDRLSRRLRSEDYSGYTVRLRLKWSDASSVTRQMSLAFPTDDERILLSCGKDLLRKIHDGRPVRLIGIAVDQLVRGNAPLPLLPDDIRRRSMIRTFDGLRNRFGESSLVPAGVLPLLTPALKRKGKSE